MPPEIGLKRSMEMEQPDNHRLSRVSGLIALTGLLAVVVGGYLYYQNSGGTDVSADLPNPPSSGTASTSASPAVAASSASAQQADAGAPKPPSADQSGQAAANNAPAIAPEPPARAPVNAQSRPTSLSSNDFAYVQKSSANIRAEPRVRGKRVGQAPKGTKLTVLSRAGKWVQVDDGATKGWVSGNLLGPRSP
jgi:cytoskeletal protein RodZ